jgi:thiamine phosphate synthase YjbQ (UPF0047 family)
MVLGTWQSIALVDPNADNAERTVVLSFLAGCAARQPCRD